MPRSAARDGSGPAVLVEDVEKRFGDVRALDGLSLAIPKGTLLALLGPNGAGKTTLVRILTTLLTPDGGRVEVAGSDVVSDRAQVRRAIGLSGQDAAIDERLTGRENLKLISRLYHLSRVEARARVGELLEQFDLIAVADRPAWSYSGGMRRRLDLAASLISRPEVLFLDEPSVGLDPTSRVLLASVVDELVEEGMTVLLTTQYLEEADQLADSIAVIDRGRLIASGTSNELKGTVGHRFIEVAVVDHDQAQAAADVMSGVVSGALGGVRIRHHSGRVIIPVAGHEAPLADIAKCLEEAGIPYDDLALRQPTLDDVFMTLTGDAPRPSSPPGESPDLDVGSGDGAR